MLLDTRIVLNLIGLVLAVVAGIILIKVITVFLRSGCSDLIPNLLSWRLLAWLRSASFLLFWPMSAGKRFPGWPGFPGVHCFFNFDHPGYASSGRVRTASG